MSAIVSIDVKSTPEARGRRLKSLRKMADLSRKALTLRYQISASTIQAWEDGKAGGLTKKGAQRIIAALREEGVYCTVEWLLHGVGQTPYLAERAYLHVAEPMASYHNVIEIPEAESITKELLTFRQFHPNAIDMIVNDDGMLPFYKAGDTIAGVRQQGKVIDQLIGKDCIVEIESGEVLFRRLRQGNVPDTFSLVCINLDTVISAIAIYNVRLLSAAPIIWHRRPQ